jgi:hypothetical protein
LIEGGWVGGGRDSINVYCLGGLEEVKLNNTEWGVIAYFFTGWKYHLKSTQLDAFLETCGMTAC